MKKSIMCMLVLSNLLMADFVRDNTKNVVKDTASCLMWQDNVDSKTVRKKWIDAIEYCENLSLAGFDDWRLPNFNELYSIGDRSRYAPAIQIAFSNVVSDGYWSATTTGHTSVAWVVDFDYGNDHGGYKTGDYYVRCVRDGQ